MQGIAEGFNIRCTQTFLRSHVRCLQLWLEAKNKSSVWYSLISQETLWKLQKKMSNKHIPKIGPLQAPSPRTEELWHEPHNAQHSARQNDRRTACRALPDSDKEWKAPIQLKPNTEDCSLSLDNFSLRIPPNHVGQGFSKLAQTSAPSCPKSMSMTVYPT